MVPPFGISMSFRTAQLAETCVFCQSYSASRPLFQTRRIHSSVRRLQQPSPSKPAKPTPSASPSKTPAPPQSPTVKALPSRLPRVGNRPHIRARDGELVPAPLSLPLGLPHPPSSGENTGTDARSWRQRRADFISYDKHLERRQSLIKDLYEKNYFRDLGNVGRIHKGKSMLAPATPFRKEVALWFPNFRGGTIEGGGARDTTDVLRGKVTIVKLISTDWADIQAESFVGRKENEEMWGIIEGSGKGIAQMVEINVEANPLKYWLVWLFMGRLRKLKPKEQWSRYFLVQKGLDDDVKEALGVWNAMVGYVYLLDKDCKIRWAGNGDAREDERKSLANCLKRLVDEAKGVERPRMKRADPTPASGLKKEDGSLRKPLTVGAS